MVLHGLFGMLDNWVTIAKKLSDDYRLVLVDQRNHGRSFHSDEFTYQLLADDLAALLDTLDLDAAHIIGHSMGGKTAMEFAQRYPDRCKSLMVVDIAPRVYPDGHSSIFEAIFAMDLTKVTKRSDADEQLAESISDWSVRQFLLKNLNRQPDGFSWKANFQSLYDNYGHMKGAITLEDTLDIPALFVRGSRSDYITDEDMELIHRYFAKAELITLDAGHWVHAERPQELMGIIRDFI